MKNFAWCGATQRAFCIVRVLIGLLGRVTMRAIRRDRAPSTGAIAAQSLERLGGAFLKAGQALSTRGDLLDDQTRRSLGRLCDDVAPLPHTAVVRILQEATTSHRSDPFVAVSPEPIGCGSAAEVHTAICSGDTVAIKFLRPGVRRQFNADLLLAHGFCRFVSFTRLAPSVPLMSGLETLQAALRGHVDLAREAAVQQGFQQRFDGRSTLRIPRVLPDLCTSDVLVMEYISGAVRIDAQPCTIRRDGGHCEWHCAGCTK